MYQGKRRLYDTNEVNFGLFRALSFDLFFFLSLYKSLHKSIVQRQLKETRTSTTCITDLPDCHIFSVCDVDISSVIGSNAFWVVHPSFSWPPIYMPSVPFR